MASMDEQGKQDEVERYRMQMIELKAAKAGLTVEQWKRYHRAQDKEIWVRIRRRDELRSAPSQGWNALSLRAQALGHGWEVVR